jgi:GNAT superfamily N-acetyltransferase
VASRFISNLLTLLIGAWLMAARFVFGPGSLRWIVFGGASAIVIVTLLAFLARGRGVGQRLIDAAVLLAGGWLVVASLTYSTGTAGWIALGAGGACALLALIGLIAHEAITERAVARTLVRQSVGAPEDDGAEPRPSPIAVGA